MSGLDTSDLITDNAVLIASATSVLINFACVQILNELFGRCAKARVNKDLYDDRVRLKLDGLQGERPHEGLEPN